METTNNVNEVNLDEKGKRLDVIQGERRGDLDECQDQVTELLDAEVTVPQVPVPEVKVSKENKIKILDTIPTVQAEHKTEHKPLVLGRDFVEDCLGLSKILRRILEQLSNRELIKVSLVNKLWNYEARSVLRDRGSLTARIYKRPACLGLVQFAADLQQMRVVPFARIKLWTYHDRGGYDACQSLSSETLNPSYQVILDRLPWRHLSVLFSGDMPELKDRPAFLLVKRVLEDYCSVLEELSFGDCQYQLAEFLQSIFESRSFSFLKVLRFTRPVFYRESATPYTPAFVKTVVSAAPSLEKLYLDGPIKFQENVMDGSSAVLVATSGLHPLKEPFCESLLDALRAESMDLCCQSYESFDVELINRFIPMVLQALHTRLKTLRMDLLFAVPLMCYGIVFENVKELVICATDSTVEGVEPHILALVKAFDFTHVFPKLDKVKIRDSKNLKFSSENISGFIERGNAVATKAVSDGATNIRHLELHYYQKDSTAPLIFLAQMFPHVKTLSMKTENLREFPFTLLWEHFGCLAELHVNVYLTPRTINLDSVFCGIFPEEVAELRAKDDEYLKAVNIVPVMPSIGCMRGLRLFTLRYPLHFATSEDSTWMFSKVTGLIGFHKCPQLSVKLHTSFRTPKALDHMKPYVTSVN